MILRTSFRYVRQTGRVYVTATVAVAGKRHHLTHRATIVDDFVHEAAAQALADRLGLTVNLDRFERTPNLDRRYTASTKENTP